MEVGLNGVLGHNVLMNVLAVKQNANVIVIIPHPIMVAKNAQDLLLKKINVIKMDVQVKLHSFKLTVVLVLN